jgi:sulfonate transport system permease protein
MGQKKLKEERDEKTLIDKIQPFVQWILPIVVIVLWVLATMSSDFKMKLLPSPLSVIERAIKMAKEGDLWFYFSVSARRAFAGLFIGGTLGYLLGMLNGMSKVTNAFLNTSVQMFRTIPILGMLPLLIIYLGIGEEMKIFVVAFGVFFPMYLNTYGGVRTIDSKLFEMSKVYGFSKLKLFTDVILPGSLQNVLVGVRTALGAMWLILIAAEMIGAEAGLGFMVTQARERMQMDIVFLAIFIYAILGKLTDLTAVLLEKRFLRWKCR